MKVTGTKKRETGQLLLELADGKGFSPSSVETFSLEALDVGDVKKIEVCSKRDGENTY